MSRIRIRYIIKADSDLQAHFYRDPGGKKLNKKFENKKECQLMTANSPKKILNDNKMIFIFFLFQSLLLPLLISGTGFISSIFYFPDPHLSCRTGFRRPPIMRIRTRNNSYMFDADYISLFQRRPEVEPTDKAKVLRQLGSRM